MRGPLRLPAELRAPVVRVAHHELVRPVSTAVRAFLQSSQFLEATPAPLASIGSVSLGPFSTSSMGYRYTPMYNSLA